MARTQTPKALHLSLTERDITTFAALLEDLSERTDQGLSLEHLDGFITALICGPRLILPTEYFPVLLGETGLGVFRDPDEIEQFMSLFHRRWNQIAHALAAPIETLADPAALEPLIMDWEGLLEELQPDERAALEADGLPEFASVWAAGFLQVLDAWEVDWTLPADSKDEAFVDEMLDPFFVLITPIDDWTPEERATRREDYVAMAIWSAYELYDFWRDRGCATARTPLSVAVEAGRNVPCPCGSGKNSSNAAVPQKIFINPKVHYEHPKNLLNLCHAYIDRVYFKRNTVGTTSKTGTCEYQQRAPHYVFGTDYRNTGDRERPAG